MQGYCVKCREKKEFESTEKKEYNTSRGLKFARIGFCPDCNTKISVMVGKDG